MAIDRSAPPPHDHIPRHCTHVDRRYRQAPCDSHARPGPLSTRSTCGTGSPIAANRTHATRRRGAPPHPCPLVGVTVKRRRSHRRRSHRRRSRHLGGARRSYAVGLHPSAGRLHSHSRRPPSQSQPPIAQSRVRRVSRTGGGRGARRVPTACLTWRPACACAHAYSQDAALPLLVE